MALMGSSLSKQQEDPLTEYFWSVVILLDGDEAGPIRGREIALRLVKRTSVRIVELPDGKQPDQLSVEEIEGLLANIF